MLKTLALTAAIGTFSALLVVDAGALPLAQAKQTVAQSDTGVQNGIPTRKMAGRSAEAAAGRSAACLVRCLARIPASRLIHLAPRPETNQAAGYNRNDLGGVP
jgi:hypothetical protein